MHKVQLSETTVSTLLQLYAIRDDALSCLSSGTYCFAVVSTGVPAQDQIDACNASILKLIARELNIEQ